MRGIKWDIFWAKMRRAGFAWPTEPCMIKQMNTTCWALHSSKHRDAAATTSQSHKATEVQLVPMRARFQPFCLVANLGSSACDAPWISFCRFGAYATDDHVPACVYTRLTTAVLLFWILFPGVSQSHRCCQRGYSVDQPIASTITTLKVMGIPSCQLAASSASYIYGLQRPRRMVIN